MTKPDFWLGVGMHHTVEHFHREQEKNHAHSYFLKWVKDECGEEIPNNLRPNMALGIDMAQAYQKWFFETLLRRIVFQQWETPFRVPIKNTAGQVANACFSGRIDGIAFYNRGLWVVEYKTTSNPDAFLDSLDNDLQATGYQWLMREVGRPVLGTLYILMSKKKTGPRVVMQPIGRTTNELNRYSDYLYTLANEITDPNHTILPVDGESVCRFCDYRFPCAQWWSDLGGIN
jgi:hypothetical protein